MDLEWATEICVSEDIYTIYIERMTDKRYIAKGKV